MNDYWNKYTYEMFKMLNDLNMLEDQTLEISKFDLDILLSFQKEINIFKDLNFDEYLNLIKKLSLQFTKTPIQIATILHKNNI